MILAIDIGTSSIRAALYDDTANLVGRTLAKREYALSATSDGGFEINADALFGHVVDAVDGVLRKAARRSKTDIECIASCSFWHSLMGVDDRGRPTTPVFGWADGRSGRYTAVLRERLDERAVHARTGSHFHSSYWPAKLLWIRRELPRIWAKTVRWLSFADYVCLKLAGEATTSISMASGTGVFNIRECKWDAELCRHLRVRRSALPRVANDGETFKLMRSFARRWPALRKAVFFPATGDGAADSVGAGCMTRDRAALMIGTSAALRIVYRGKPPVRIPNGLFCYRLDSNCVVLGGALSDGGNLYQWLTATLDLPRNRADEMGRRGADAHGLTFLPFLHGERSTGYHDGARGAVLGLTASHDAVDIMQAGLESVAYRLAEIFDRLSGVAPIETIVASGGALRESPVWTQIIADVLGWDLRVRETGESAMRGAVLLALESLGKIESIDSFPVSTAKLEFHPKCHVIYKQARRRHDLAYKRLLADKP